MRSLLPVMTGELDGWYVKCRYLCRGKVGMNSHTISVANVVESL